MSEFQKFMTQLLIALWANEFREVLSTLLVTNDTHESYKQLTKAAKFFSNNYQCIYNINFI